MAVVINDRQEQFYWAAGEGDTAIVDKLLVSGGVKINEIFSRTGLTALHAAARRGHFRMVSHLISNGADFGLTPLHAAANSGEKQVVQLLLDSGAVPSKDNCTPTDVAMQAGYLDIVAMLNRHNLAHLVKGASTVRPSTPGASAGGDSGTDVVDTSSLANTILHKLRVEMATRDGALSARMSKLEHKLDAILQNQNRLLAHLLPDHTPAMPADDAVSAGAANEAAPGNGSGAGSAASSTSTASKKHKRKKSKRSGSDKERSRTKSAAKDKQPSAAASCAEAADMAAPSGTPVPAALPEEPEEKKKEREAKHWAQMQRAQAEKRWAKEAEFGTKSEDIFASLLSSGLHQSRQRAAGAPPAPAAAATGAGTAPASVPSRPHRAHSRSASSASEKLSALVAGVTPAAAPASPGPSAVPSPVETYQLSELQRFAKGHPRPAGMDRKALEQYLSDSDFAEAFGMTRVEFSTLAVWRRKNLKKQVQLH